MQDLVFLVMSINRFYSLWYWLVCDCYQINANCTLQKFKAAKI